MSWFFIYFFFQLSLGKQNGMKGLKFCYDKSIFIYILGTVSLFPVTSLYTLHNTLN